MTVYEIADTETGLTYRTEDGRPHAEAIGRKHYHRTGNPVEITQVDL